MEVLMERFGDKVKKVREKIKLDVFDEDKKGRAVIKVNVIEGENILSSYNDDGQEIISSEMAGFVDNLVKSVPDEKDIVLQIKCKDLDKEKEKVYKKAIVNYYMNEFADNDAKLKNNAVISLVLFVIGLLGFAGLYLWRLFGGYWLIADILEVTAWVFLWETVDVFFLRRGAIRHKQKRNIKIIYAEIQVLAIEK